MATIVGKRFNRPSASDKNWVANAVYDWLTDNLGAYVASLKSETVSEDPNVSYFVEGTKIYYSEHSYLYVYKCNADNAQNPYVHCRLTAGTDAAGAVYATASGTLGVVSVPYINSNYAAYVEIAQSYSGDILISFYRGDSLYFTSKLERYRYALAVCKCKSIINNTETTGAIVMYSEDSLIPVYLIADDVEEIVPGGTSNAITTTTLGNTSMLISTGRNSNAKYTAIMPICCVSSEYAAVNVYRLLFTPEWTVGNAELNDKTYYFADNIAMLDE